MSVAGPAGPACAFALPLYSLSLLQPASRLQMMITHKAANTHFTHSCFIYRDKLFTAVNITNQLKREVHQRISANNYNFNTIAKMRRGRVWYTAAPIDVVNT